MLPSNSIVLASILHTSYLVRLHSQTFNEQDRYYTLMKNLKDAGLVGDMDDDPRRSDDIAKKGKMKMLKQAMDENSWQKFYFVMVEHTIYYYKSRKKNESANYDHDDDDEEDEEDEDEMPWKGCFDVRLATVRMGLLEPQAACAPACHVGMHTPVIPFTWFTLGHDGTGRLGAAGHLHQAQGLPD